MQPFSLSFVALVFVGLLLFHAHRGATWRRAVLMLLNIVFLASFAHSWIALLPILGFIVLSLVAVGLVRRSGELGVFVGCLATMLMAYLHLKHYAVVGFLRPLEFSYVTAGLGYMIFRVLHVLIDTYQHPERMTNLSPWKLFNYMTSFLTFTAGPVQRYEDYLEQDSKLGDLPPLEADDVRYAFNRITDGLVRLALLGPYMLVAHKYCVEHIPRYMLALGLAAISYLLFMFFNFSGYMGIVIGVGRLFGLKLPENFDSPFLATNVLDFWNRWHITVTQWFKTYVYHNLLRFFVRHTSRPALVRYAPVIGLFATFFVLGMWHDWGQCFLLLALMQGLGVAVNKLWQLELTRRLGAQQYALLAEQPRYKMLARAFALTYISLSTIPAWADVRYADLLRFVEKTSLGGIALNFVVCVLGFMAVEAAVKRRSKLLPRLPTWRPAMPAGFSHQFVISARVFALVLLLLPDAPPGTNRPLVEPDTKLGVLVAALPGIGDESVLRSASVFYGRTP